MYHSPSSDAEELVDTGRGVTICCERLGDPADPPLVLIMGLGQQLIAWPAALCEQLVARGFQVVVFDNRDIGRSTHFRVRPPRIGQLAARRFDPAQYDLHEMAADTAALIDALGLGPAHVAGVSMGGMIGQTLAARHPGQVRSLVSIMSSTGARSAGWVAPSTLRLMFRPAPLDRDGAIERAVTMFRHIGSAGFQFDEAGIRERSGAAFDRDPRAAAGMMRQLGAIMKSGDRTQELGAVAAPTLVIHGDRDRMVHPSGARATAKAIPGARLETIAGMGHDLPAGALPRIAELIAGHATAADGARASALT
jgi:pimeloyl-ACP methyl ester carboxylesterase